MWGDEPGEARVAGSLPRTEDPALVAAVAQGNREALGALYDLHAPLLFGLAKRMLGNAAAAEDLLHDVFLEAWQHAAEYSPDRGSVRSWLLVRTRSRALDRLGRGARESRITQHLSLANEGEPAFAPSPSLSVDGVGEPAFAPSPSLSVDGARLRRLLGTLPAELVAVLDLTYFEGLSASEIAPRLGIPTGTVKSRLARALEALRGAIAPARGAGATR